jgi:hypothetical protein
MPTISIVEKFRHEFEDHLAGKPCPYEHAAVGQVVQPAADCQSAIPESRVHPECGV